MSEDHPTFCTYSAEEYVLLSSRLGHLFRYWPTCKRSEHFILIVPSCLRRFELAAIASDVAEMSAAKAEVNEKQIFVRNLPFDVTSEVGSYVALLNRRIDTLPNL